MEIVVHGGDWGEGRHQDVQKLLENVSFTFFQYFDKRPEGRVHVFYRPDNPPMAAYRPAGVGDYTIFLNSYGRYWSQYSYQFAHELCHLASNHDRLRTLSNHWFHEAICELASLFVLRRMAENWRSQPPYANWMSYAPSLAKYVSDWLEKPQHHLPSGVTVGAWLRLHEDQLRSDRYQRELNGVVAAVLLPVIEEMPNGWQAVSFIPDSGARFVDFLSEWKRNCPEPYRQFVIRIEALNST